MMHPDGHAPQRPIDVPILISALGPKGLDVATELADGLFTVNGQTRYAAAVRLGRTRRARHRLGRR